MLCSQRELLTYINYSEEDEKDYGSKGINCIIRKYA